MTSWIPNAGNENNSSTIGHLYELVLVPARRFSVIRLYLNSLYAKCLFDLTQTVGSGAFLRVDWFVYVTARPRGQLRINFTRIFNVS